MSYLFGDSTPAPLEIDLIEFLRDGLDCCVELALSTDGLRREADRAAVLRHDARMEVEQLEKLCSEVESAIKAFPGAEGDGPAARCARAVLQSTNDLVRSEVHGVNAVLQTEESKVEAARAGQRENCVKALEALLLRHDLPDSSGTLRLKARTNGPYSAELQMVTPLGIVATLALEVPASHLFGHIVRVDRIVDHLEVHAPEIGGWLHKEEKMRVQRLERLYIAELDLGTRESTVGLRAGAEGSGSGFDVLISSEAPRVILKRVAEKNGSSGEPFEVCEEDGDNLLALLQKLENAAEELVDQRKALLEASLDERPLHQHDEPTVLVDRFIQAIAPVVREVAERSPSTSELVIKREVSGGHREEIFVAKSELRAKLERVPVAYRGLFDALGLTEAPPAAAMVSSLSPPLTLRPVAPRNEPVLPALARVHGAEAVKPLA